MWVFVEKLFCFCAVNQKYVDMEDQFRVFEVKLQLVGLEKLPDGKFNKVFQC